MTYPYDDDPSVNALRRDPMAFVTPQDGFSQTQEALARRKRIGQYNEDAEPLVRDRKIVDTGGVKRFADNEGWGEFGNRSLANVQTAMKRGTANVLRLPGEIVEDAADWGVAPVLNAVGANQAGDSVHQWANDPGFLDRWDDRLKTEQRASENPGGPSMWDEATRGVGSLIPMVATGAAGKVLGLAGTAARGIANMGLTGVLNASPGLGNRAIGGAMMAGMGALPLGNIAPFTRATTAGRIGNALVRRSAAGATFGGIAKATGASNDKALSDALFGFAMTGEHPLNDVQKTELAQEIARRGYSPEFKSQLFENEKSWLESPQRFEMGEGENAAFEPYQEKTWDGETETPKPFKPRAWRDTATNRVMFQAQPEMPARELTDTELYNTALGDKIRQQWAAQQTPSGAIPEWQNKIAFNRHLGARDNFTRNPRFNNPDLFDMSADLADQPQNRNATAQEVAQGLADPDSIPFRTDPTNRFPSNGFMRGPNGNPGDHGGLQIDWGNDGPQVHTEAKG